MRAAILLCLLCFGPISWAEALFNEQGYRIGTYRRATPDSAPAGQLLTTPRLQELIQKQSPVLIDVQSITVRAETAEFGFAWLPSKTRRHIEGSTWLPNVGYGELDARMKRYFQSNLQRLTKGDKDRALVFYCVVDCWMSWNAVRRASDWGYRNLYWYPQGTDGWEQAGLPLVVGIPHPMHVNPQAAPEFFTVFEQLDMQEVAQQAGASHRDILLFFETEHCPFCARMRKSVLIDQAVINKLQASFIALPLDIESDQMMRDEAGEPISVRQYAQRYKRIVLTPTMVFVDANFNLLHRHSGLIATNEEFKKLLEFVSSRAYDSYSWKHFKQQ